MTTEERTALIIDAFPRGKDAYWEACQTIAADMTTAELRAMMDRQNAADLKEGRHHMPDRFCTEVDPLVAAVFVEWFKRNGKGN
jgi:hypothetical protein